MNSSEMQNYATNANKITKITQLTSCMIFALHRLELIIQDAIHQPNTTAVEYTWHTKLDNEP